MRVTFTRASANRKTGPIPVSMSPRTTCPPSCPLRGNGCYAASGPVAWQWNRLSSSRTGFVWEAFLDEVRRLPKGTLWRHNVAGDLPGRGETIDIIMLAELVDANRGRKEFSYTHKATTRENVLAIRAANRAGFAINVSADDLVEADELASKKVGPIAVILPANAAYNHIERTPQGRKIVICPESYRDDVTCDSCRLCAEPKRHAIIGFPAHRSAFRRAERIALRGQGR